MKLLTKNTDYAVRALVRLARDPGRYLSATELARREAIPAPFLRRILQPLIRAKYLTAREGAAGGVRLRRRAAAIRLIDVIELFQGTFQISECMFRKRICPNRPTCPVRRRVAAISDRLAAEFAGITIATLARDAMTTGKKV
jgi:Rrf2 family protein